MDESLSFYNSRGGNTKMQSIETKYEKYGEVISMDVNDNNLFLIASYSNSWLIIYDLKKMVSL